MCEDLTVLKLKEWLEKVLVEHGNLPMYSSIQDGCKECELDTWDIMVKEYYSPLTDYDIQLPKRCWIGAE